MIKAVFLDFDSTTYSHVTKQIPDSAYQAIIKAQENNVKILLATGRDISELPGFDCKGIKFDGYVLDDGQLLLDKDLNVIEEIYLTEKDKKQVIEFFNKKTYPILIRTRKEGFANLLNDHMFEIYKLYGSEIPPIKEIAQDDDIMVATVYINGEEEFDYIKNLFKDSNVTRWNQYACDIVQKGSNKMRGILSYLEHYNIDINDILAIGDGENDIEMINEIPHSVAMGNSVQIIKDAAEYVTTDIDNDGIKNAFIKYKII